jgi:hypothetical protein
MNTPTDDLICRPANSADERAGSLFATIRSAYGEVAKLTDGLWSDTVAAGWGQVLERGLHADENARDAFVQAAVGGDPSARQQRRGKLFPFNRIAKAQLGGAEKLVPDVSRFAVLYSLAHQSGWGEDELAAFLASHTKDRHGRNVGSYLGGVAKARAILNGSKAGNRRIRAARQRLDGVLQRREAPAFGLLSAASVGVDHLPVGARFNVVFDIIAGPDGAKSVTACYRSNAPTAQVERWILQDAEQDWPEVKPRRSNRHDAYSEPAAPTTPSCHSEPEARQSPKARASTASQRRNKEPAP